MSTPLETVDHLVIGGGPAGSMAAILLAQAGRRVTLLEKESGAHHKVCGEFLSPEAADYLQQAGVSPRALGAASIRFLRLSSGRDVTQAALPFRALSLSRRALDAAMLQRAADQGCNVLRGRCVQQLAPNGNAWIATLTSGASLRAQTVFLATGKHDLHGWRRGGGRQSDLVGFKLHWQLSPSRIEELRETMELFLFPGGYGGLSLVESEIANLCLVVRRSRLNRMRGWNGLLASFLRDNQRLRHYLQDSNAQWPRPLAISPIPYGYLGGSTRGPWCVGDQAAVIPSFTGDGMSIALHSAALAAQMVLAGKSVEEYNRTLHAQLGPGMSLAIRLSRAMVTAAGRNLAVPALSLFPQAMQWIAASTRIPAQALPAAQSAFAQSD
jgi:flavin-dependent dehydrogenase